MNAVLISFCPQKLLKITRVHRIIGFIANAVAFYFFIVNTQHRATTNDVESPINFEKFKCGGNLGELLHFIKNNKRFACNKLFCRVNDCNTFYHFISFIAIAQNHFVLWLFHKIDIDNIFVVLSTEAQY